MPCVFPDMSTSYAANESAATLLLQVAGMSCDACVRHVTRALEGLSGVLDVHVDLDTARVVVTQEPGQADLHDILQAISRAGYSARLEPEPTAVTEPADPYIRAGGCCRTRAADRRPATQ